MIPTVDLVVLTRDSGRLRHEVDQGIQRQQGVRIICHRIIGRPRSANQCRWETISQARNDAKRCGSSPWLMFLDDDVVLHPACVAALIDELRRRPAYAALAADYLGERRAGQIARHVSMGATLFRREALNSLRFTWRETACECQCCCDDLRRNHWGIDYYSAAQARHLPKNPSGDAPSAEAAAHHPSERTGVNERALPGGAQIPSVCLVLCYLGRLPGWIDRFLLSCAYNPTIDFLIFTDQANFPAASPNVRVKHLDAALFNALATKTIGVEVKLSHPRKLCDFKPAYGHLFEEHLSGWDYWGYGDIDVIYGNVRKFLSAARLHEHEVFSARKEFLVGHFTLFRNTPRMKWLYQHSADLRQTLQAPDVKSFDECGLQWRRRMRGEPLTDRAACDSMTHIVHRLMADDRISACFTPAVVEWPELAAPNWRLVWEAGRLSTVNQRREVMYFHFHGFKQRPGYREPCRQEGDAPFEMSANGFERAVRVDGVRKKILAPKREPEYLRILSPAISSVNIADQRASADAAAPRVLLTFNRRHLQLVRRRFLASCRAAGVTEDLYPVAVGLYPTERARLAQVSGVKPTFRHDTGEHVARRRLREFADITRALPPATPVAYWDAGDVLFQSPLTALWDLVRAHPGKLLAVREPSGHPENPAVVQWTETISDPVARRDAQQAIFHQPFLNSGFLAGSAAALTKYFETAAPWYDAPKLAGTGDPGDQLALNVYCHSHPEAWQEISESWNYCLWGRRPGICRRGADERFIDVRGVPIHVVHGNAQTLRSIPLGRQRAYPPMRG